MKYLIPVLLYLVCQSATAEFRATQYLQTNSLSLNTTHTHIVNTSDTAQQFTATLYDGAGKQLGEASLALSQVETPSRGRLVVTSDDLELLFGVSAWSGPAVLEITGTASFEVMSKLTSPSGLVSNTNCVRQNSVHNIEGFDSPSGSFIRIINTGDSPIVEVIGTLYDQSGEVIGGERRLLLKQLGAKASEWVTRDRLSIVFGDTWNGEAYLEIINPDEDLRLLNLNYSDSTFFNFSCYEAAQGSETQETPDETEPVANGGTGYRVTFFAEWSAETHPTGYPTSAHFSPLVGVTHSSNVEFWAEGATVSSAIESVAELGLTSGLSSLISSEIANGNANDSEVAVNLTTPGSLSIEVNATEEHALLTLISMVAPSPDWFVGVNSLDLRQNGEWRDNIEIDLFAYDAGTEEGSTFSLSNPETNPAEPISRLMEDPLPSGSPRLGYFLIELTE